MSRELRRIASDGTLIGVWRDGVLVEGPGHAPAEGGAYFVPDIKPFRTQEGVAISSRSDLRAYEQRTGSKQCGNDWTGPSKPGWWDSYKESKRSR